MRYVLAFLLFWMVPVCSGASLDLSSTSSIDAFRVSPPDEKRKATRRTFHGQRVIAGPRRLPKAAAQAIARELERVYLVDHPPTYCAFVPRYGLRLRLANRTMEVLVCPHCGHVEFPADIRKQYALLSSELLRRLKAVFPDYPLHRDEA